MFFSTQENLGTFLPRLVCRAINEVMTWLCAVKCSTFEREKSCRKVKVLSCKNIQLPLIFTPIQKGVFFFKNG